MDHLFKARNEQIDHARPTNAADPSFSALRSHFALVDPCPSAVAKGQRSPALVRIRQSVFQDLCDATGSIEKSDRVREFMLEAVVELVLFQVHNR